MFFLFVNVKVVVGSREALVDFWIISKRMRSCVSNLSIGRFRLSSGSSGLLAGSAIPIVIGWIPSILLVARYSYHYGLDSTPEMKP